MKKLVKIAVVLVILLVCGLIAVALSINSIVKKGVETAGPKIAKVDVKLGGANISLLSGGGSISDLVIGNPEGYKSPSAVTVGTARLRLEPMSVFSSKVVIRELALQSPEITIEGGLGDNNLKKIQANINGTASAEKSAPAGAATGTTKKLQVDDFTLTGAKVHLKLTSPMAVDTTISIPDIHLTGLGQGPDGITPGDLSKELFGTVVEKVLEAAPAAIANLTKNAGNLIKGAGQEATKGVEKVTKGLGGLLKK